MTWDPGEISKGKQVISLPTTLASTSIPKKKLPMLFLILQNDFWLHFLSQNEKEEDMHP